MTNGNFYTLKEEVNNLSFPPNYHADLFFYYKARLYFNCYAYAMQFNIPISTFSDNFYNPGFLSNSTPENVLYDANSLISSFINDCDFLGISYKETSIEDTMEDDSYKIGILLENRSRILDKTGMFLENNDEEGPDFHFIRQNRNSVWSEKCGWGGIIRLLNKPGEDDRYELLKVMKISKKG
jgi:hypothetical protein